MCEQEFPPFAEDYEYVDLSHRVELPLANWDGDENDLEYQQSLFEEVE